VLADSDKRAAYDRFGHAGVGGAGAGFPDFNQVIFQDFGDILGDLFGFGDLFGMGGGRRRSRTRRGGDLREDLTLEFEEAVFGTETNITIQRHEGCETCRGTGLAPGKSAVTCRTCGGHGQVRYQQGFFAVARTCSSCHGAGQTITDPCLQCRGQGQVLRERELAVKVPAGVEDGTRIRYAGQGEAGAHGGPPGDLYVVLAVKEHSFFEREGKDLYCGVPISIAQAALGAQISIPTLEGEHTLKIPEGTQSGTVFRIRHQGVPSLNGHGRGDLRVEVKVQVPARLNKRQRELLHELETLTPVENKPQRRSLLSRVKEIFGS
jgi:molecular chaperone DnaJ